MENFRLPFPFSLVLVLVFVLLVLDFDLIHNPSLVLPRLGMNTLKVLILMGSFGNHDADDILQGDEYIKTCYKVGKSYLSKSITSTAAGLAA